MIRRPPRSTLDRSSAASDVYKRQALPYKFKFKFSGCPNDCMNSIQRSDMAIIGTWRDNIQTDAALAKKWFAKHGMNELVNDVVGMCPTRAIQLKEIKDVRKDANISSVAVNDSQALELSLIHISEPTRPY